MNTITDLNVIDVLDRAEQAITTRGWCRDDFTDSVGRVCLEGAVRLAVTGHADTLYAEMADQQAGLLDSAMDYVVRAIRERDASYDRPQPEQIVPFWNDELGRTVDDVLAVLRAARALAGGAS